ncbi:uncharacterized protein ASPGLDRAFT_48590 [Aspergillus glaucus CBS 516.65]|uniref:Uncharacterized protein n=1 Tax=Aspergillus glaucus CBS 516.65 TaxID=1160497 RepID=A0A1L9VGY4_ASPGL|nr:hypothetical protein ASPGLDRAFT_48590 [Aspergillus glaucus CBS 516.65]OJJ83201.1 hypothetical protein ASPGLDRAFT_48590 [Aspergillus glaucus CBS 516.65]
MIDGSGMYSLAVLVGLVMIETWDGISRRVALGQAYLVAWIKTCPRFSTSVVA